jgi:hypothetical protein
MLHNYHIANMILIIIYLCSLKKETQMFQLEKVTG